MYMHASEPVTMRRRYLSTSVNFCPGSWDINFIFALFAPDIGYYGGVNSLIVGECVGGVHLFFIGWGATNPQKRRSDDV